MSGEGSVSLSQPTQAPALQVAGPVLMSTAGATGKEVVKAPTAKDRSSRHGRRRHQHHQHQHKRHRTVSSSGTPRATKPRRSKSTGGNGGPTSASNVVLVPAAPPLFDDAPLVKDDNMAGYVDRQIRTVLGVEQRVIKMVNPFNQSKLTYEPYLHFKIRSSSDEHIRFRRNALTLLFFASYANPSAKAKEQGADQAKEESSKRHALRANKNLPFMWMDPSVGATGFFSHVEVLIDNVPVTSNQLMGGLWLQYARSCEVFSNKDNTRLKTHKELSVTDDLDKPWKRAIREAVAPFSYSAWNSTTGRRIEANLRGSFPFEFKNEAAASADNMKEPNYYFPPNTTFDFRFHFHPDKFAAVFHPTIAGNMAEYFEKRAAAEGAPADPAFGVGEFETKEIRYQIAQAFLEYESVVLRPEQKLKYLELMRKGVPAVYRYDVVRGQHVSLPSSQAYVDLPFTIAPYARLLFILFLPDWSVVSMPVLRRPLAALSRFPENCSKLSMLFAGQTPLITSEFERLGFTGEQHHSTQRVLYHYLKEHRVWSGDFEELFPGDSSTYPFNQMLYVDLRENMSSTAETLNMRMTFSEKTSPADRQVVVLSVHSTGEVTCRHAGGPNHYDWRWESKY